MRVTVLLILLLTACGTNETDLVYPDEATCWYENGDPTLHRYYPKGHVYDAELELACERLGRPVTDQTEDNL